MDSESFSTSGYEDDGSSSSTRSLTNSVWSFVKENGRTYHGYRAGAYPFPNDPTENERLNFQYALLRHLLKGKLHLAPLSSPSNILDIGTGTGVWAMDMGDEYPSTIIEGTDLSPIQPTAVPDNVHFLIDDAEQEDWAVPPNHYDFIHTRMMLGCFRDFKAILMQAYQHLKPGGWMECQEAMFPLYCDDGTMPEDWAFKHWHDAVEDASMKLERPLSIADKLKTWFEEAGYVDIHEQVFKLPLNNWPQDPDLKTVGTWWQQNLLIGLQGFSLAYFSRALGWTKDEIEVYLVRIRNCIKDKHIRAYHKFYVVYGRKPETPLEFSTNTNTLPLCSPQSTSSSPTHSPSEHSAH